MAWIRRYKQRKKGLFPEFQLISILHFQVMPNYVCFIASIDYCAAYSLVYETFCENCSHFIRKWFQPNSFGEVGFLEKSYKNMQKIQISTSGNMPLKGCPKHQSYGQTRNKTKNKNKQMERRKQKETKRKKHREPGYKRGGQTTVLKLHRIVQFLIQSTTHSAAILWVLWWHTDNLYFLSLKKKLRITCFFFLPNLALAWKSNENEYKRSISIGSVFFFFFFFFNSIFFGGGMG